MSRHLLVGSPRSGKQLGRALVLKLALRLRHFVVDGCAHQRVHEGERALGLEDLRSRQRRRPRAGGSFVEARQRGHCGNVRAVAEHRRRPRHPYGLLRKPSQSGEHRPRHRPRSEVGDQVHVRCVRAHPLGIQRLQELVEEQRISAGGGMAGGREPLVRVCAEPFTNEIRCGERAQRCGRIETVSESPAISPKAADSTPGPEVRTLHTTKTGRPSSRRTR